MKPTANGFVIVGGGLLWLSLVAYGAAQWMAYEHIAGPTARLPLVWPLDSMLPHDTRHGTIVMFVHPRCACTRAGLVKLRDALATRGARPTCHVLFLPALMNDSGQSLSANWQTAAEIDQAQLQNDMDGSEAARFGATTSGYVLYYDPRGALRFAGGLTAQRGGEAASAYEQGLRHALTTPGYPLIHAPVFGCALLNRTETDHPERSNPR